MATLLDLLKLVLQSLAITVGSPGFAKWFIGALVVAVLSFFLNSYFCRLWNRRYDFTLFHTITFVTAAGLAFLAVLILPATVNLDSAINGRIQGWKDHLINAKVPNEESWREAWSAAGNSDQGPTTPWPHALAFRTREHLEKCGFAQRPVSGQTVVFTGIGGSGEEAEKFEFEQAVLEFRDLNPFLGPRLMVNDPGTLQDFGHAKSQLRNPSGNVDYEDIADAIGTILQQALQPQVKDLAFWTRIVVFALLFLSIALPSLASGILSYGQIRVGLRKPRPGSDSGRAPTPSARGRLSRRR